MSRTNAIRWLTKLPAGALVLLYALAGVAVYGLAFIAFGRNHVTALLFLVAVVSTLLSFQILRWTLRRADRRRNREVGEVLGKRIDAARAAPRDESSSDQEISVRERLQGRWSEVRDILADRGYDFYTHPWYLILGRSQSGKTTLIKKSDQEFPAGDEPTVEFGGTKGCNWFFTNDAILIDTAGRYVDHFGNERAAWSTVNEESEAEWRAFLTLLRDLRSRSPINGVILTIRAQDLLADDADCRAETARIARGALKEIGDHLDVRIPVYVVVTMCDYLVGFVDYFGRLPGESEKSLFGWSTPSSHRAPFARTDLEDGLRGVCEAIDRDLARFLHEQAEVDHEADFSRRDRMTAFPLEFRRFLPQLVDTISDVFARNAYADPHFFRGVYFTSGHQEGRPIRNACSAVLGPVRTPTQEPAHGGIAVRAYFVRDLFEQRTFREQGLIERTDRANRELRKQKLLFAAASGVVLAGLSCTASVSIYRVWSAGNGPLQALNAVSGRSGEVHANPKLPEPFDPLELLKFGNELDRLQQGNFLLLDQKVAAVRLAGAKAYARLFVEHVAAPALNIALDPKSSALNADTVGLATRVLAYKRQWKLGQAINGDESPLKELFTHSTVQIVPGSFRANILQPPEQQEFVARCFAERLDIKMLREDWLIILDQAESKSDRPVSNQPVSRLWRSLRLPYLDKQCHDDLTSLEAQARGLKPQSAFSAIRRDWSERLHRLRGAHTELGTLLDFDEDMRAEDEIAKASEDVQRLQRTPSGVDWTAVIEGLSRAQARAKEGGAGWRVLEAYEEGTPPRRHLRVRLAAESLKALRALEDMLALDQQLLDPTSPTFWKLDNSPNSAPTASTDRGLKQILRNRIQEIQAIVQSQKPDSQVRTIAQAVTENADSIIPHLVSEFRQTVVSRFQTPENIRSFIEQLDPRSGATGATKEFVPYHPATAKRLFGVLDSLLEIAESDGKFKQAIGAVGDAYAAWYPRKLAELPNADWLERMLPRAQPQWSSNEPGQPLAQLYDWFNSKSCEEFVQLARFLRKLEGPGTAEEFGLPSPVPSELDSFASAHCGVLKHHDIGASKTDAFHVDGALDEFQARRAEPRPANLGEEQVKEYLLRAIRDDQAHEASRPGFRAIRHAARLRRDVVDLRHEECSSIAARVVDRGHVRIRQYLGAIGKGLFASEWQKLGDWWRKLDRSDPSYRDRWPFIGSFRREDDSNTPYDVATFAEVQSLLQAPALGVIRDHLYAALHPAGLFWIDADPSHVDVLDALMIFDAASSSKRALTLIYSSPQRASLGTRRETDTSHWYMFLGTRLRFDINSRPTVPEDLTIVLDEGAFIDFTWREASQNNADESYYRYVDPSSQRRVGASAEEGWHAFFRFLYESKGERELADTMNPDEYPGTRRVAYVELREFPPVNRNPRDPRYLKLAFALKPTEGDFVLHLPTQLRTLAKIWPN